MITLSATVVAAALKVTRAQQEKNACEEKWEMSVLLCVCVRVGVLVCVFAGV